MKRLSQRAQCHKPRILDQTCLTLLLNTAYNLLEENVSEVQIRVVIISLKIATWKSMQHFPVTLPTNGIK